VVSVLVRVGDSSVCVERAGTVGVLWVVVSRVEAFTTVSELVAVHEERKASEISISTGKREIVVFIEMAFNICSS
jgi:hypothetical protein